MWDAFMHVIQLHKELHDTSLLKSKGKNMTQESY